MTANEFREVIANATKEFCRGVPIRAGAPFRIQFSLDEGRYENIIMQLSIGMAEDLEWE